MANSQRLGPLGAGSAPERDRSSRMELSPAARVAGVAPVGREVLTDEQQALLLDVTQIVLDIVGVFEPTPFADTTNAVISATRSDWTGAGLSLLGVIPYVGDVAKAGKFPRYLKIIERAINEARTNRAFAILLTPKLVHLWLADLGEHLPNFEGKPTLRLSRAGESASRASDTMAANAADPTLRARLFADEQGRYLVPGTDMTRAADRDASAVPYAWNKMSALEIQKLPPSSILLDGAARAQAGKPGGGAQLMHGGQLSPDGRVLRAAQREIVDGMTRLPGGKTSIGSH